MARRHLLQLGASAVLLCGVGAGAQPAAQAPAPAAPAPPAPITSPAPALVAPVTRRIAQPEAEWSRAARLQTILARSGFSPGLIDGKPGRKTKIALEHFQRAHELTITGAADEPTLAALAGADKLVTTDTWTRPYRITEADVALITGPIPTDWNERATLTRSGYADLQELLAERGWCSTDLVATLNPGVALGELKAGDEVILPDVQAKPLPRLARIEIDLTEKLVLGFDAKDTQVMLVHCSIARLAEKRPAGELHVSVVAMDPEYTFDPKDWPEVDNVSTRLRIAPGPRNPVGMAWVGLDKPGYGMHGTVRPQDIGKTGSHGCFRLANWDAVRLAKAVKVGTPVAVNE
ncbi:MAG: L,D-transpeptidase family protein [Phycisphaerales bacterium]